MKKDQTESQSREKKDIFTSAKIDGLDEKLEFELPEESDEDFASTPVENNRDRLMNAISYKQEGNFSRYLNLTREYS